MSRYMYTNCGDKDIFISQDISRGMGMCAIQYCVRPGESITSDTYTKYRGSGLMCAKIHSREYILSDEMEFPETGRTIGPDTDAEEEAAENLPGDKIHIGSVNPEVILLHESLRAAEMQLSTVQSRLDSSESALQTLENDIGIIRRAIGQEEMDRILGTIPENRETDLYIGTATKSKWIGR